MRQRKLDQKLADLHKIKNQIRIELNKIRHYPSRSPHHSPIYSHRKNFPQRNLSSNNLFGPFE